MLYNIFLQHHSRSYKFNTKPSDFVSFFNRPNRNTTTDMILNNIES